LRASIKQLQAHIIKQLQAHIIKRETTMSAGTHTNI
jgi:hypothetical protein